MPSGRDWIDLVRATFHDVGRRELSGLYSLDWPQAKEKLIARHRAEIQAHRGRFGRFLRTANAVLYGLSERLAPARRALFGIVLLCILFSMQGPTVFRYHSVAKGVRRTVEYSFYFGNGLLITALVLTILLLAMELVDKINYRDELQLARELQASLIPRVLPTPPGYELGAHNEIANLVGGDIYDFVPLPGNRLAVLFGDASGHGMTAGLVMAVAHAAFRTQLEVDPAPEAVFATLNRILCRTGGPRAFFSAVYLLMERDGAFAGSLAGHPPVLRIRAEGGVLERIGRGAYPLGIRSTLAWPVESGRLASGEALLLYSDGVTETRSAAGEDYGDARLESLLARLGRRSSSDLVENVAAELRAFRRDAPPEDDVSIALIRRLG